MWDALLCEEWCPSHLISTIWLQFTTLQYVLLTPFVSRVCICMGQSLLTSVYILALRSFFIDHNLCMGSGIRHFQALFCANAAFINEIPGLTQTAIDLLYIDFHVGGNFYSKNKNLKIEISLSSPNILLQSASSIIELAAVLGTACSEAARAIGDSFPTVPQPTAPIIWSHEG